MLSALDKVTGSQLLDIGLVQAMSVGGEVDLLDGGILPEPGVIEQVLASPVLAFLPFSVNEEGHDFIGAGRFQVAGALGSLISIPHPM